MSKPEILQIGAYPEWDQPLLEERFVMHRYFEAADKKAFLAELGPRIKGIATNGEKGASREIIESCPNLRIISVFGVGYDAVDLAACREHHVRVTNTPDVLTEDVADLAVAMMLALGRGVVGADRWVRSGDWAAKGPYPLQRRVHGARAGILGLGRIGMAVAKRLRGFDMEVAYSNPQPKEYAADLHYLPDPVALAEWSDVLFVTLAATRETRHIVGPAVIAALGREGMLINASRAANVDEEALLKALEARELGGAALDVFEGEPNVEPRFKGLDNVLLQPHQGSATFRTRKEMGGLVRENLTAFFEGHPLLTPVI